MEKIIKKIDKHGNVCYYNEQGQLHREDGPAIEHVSGNKFWYYNDELIGESSKGYTQAYFEKYVKLKVFL